MTRRDLGMISAMISGNDLGVDLGCTHTRADAPQAVHETYELKEGPPWSEVDGGGDAHTTLVFIGRQILCSSSIMI